MGKNIDAKDVHLYRPGVGIILLNHQEDIFMAQRADRSSPAWQMPQGGIDEGESPEQAVWRELKEEVGTDKALLLRRSGLWHFYDLPEDLKGKLWGGKFIGQRQKWYLLRFNGGDNDINIKSTPNPEFTAWRWVPKEQVIKLIVPFKRDLYRAVLREFFPTIKFPRL